MLEKFLSAETMQYALPASIALAVVLALVLVLRGRRKSEFTIDAPAGKSSEFVRQGTGGAERRNSLRREGTPVKILINSNAFKDGTNTGYVLDRSTGGLRIAMQAGMAAGSTLQVRASHAPETIPWVTVIVRNCKNTGEHFEMGCEFEKMPPWNLLLLFG